MDNEEILNIGKGTIIANRYEIVHMLGEGAMGNVYVTKHKQLSNKEFVLKILKQEIVNSEETVERFRNEVIAALDVSHKNVVRAYEFIKEDSLVAYSMEYIQGGDLADKMEELKHLEVDLFLEYLSQIFQGTKALHDKGIIHRDLKPENILISKDGTLKISDFGISVLETESRKTEAGSILGSTNYLAPEYIQEQTVNAQTDIYSIGIIAFELITGQEPFEGENIYIKMQKKILSEPIDPKSIRSDLPQVVVDLILKMLEKDPKKRFQNCEEILQRISELQNNPDLLSDEAPRESFGLSIDSDQAETQASSQKRKKQDSAANKIDLSGALGDGNQGFEQFLDMDEQSAPASPIVDHEEEQEIVRYDNQIVDISQTSNQSQNDPFRTAAILQGDRKVKPLYLIGIPVLMLLLFFFIAFLIRDAKQEAKYYENLSMDAFEPNVIDGNVIKNIRLNGMQVGLEMIFQSNNLKDLEFAIIFPPNNQADPSLFLKQIVLTEIILKEKQKGGFKIIGNAGIEIYHNQEIQKFRSTIALDIDVNDKEKTIVINFKSPEYHWKRKGAQSFDIKYENNEYKFYAADNFTIYEEDIPYRLASQLR